jgi:hypothetical protein
VGFFPFSTSVQQVAWLPGDNGLVVASDDLGTAVDSNGTMIAGTLYLTRLDFRNITKITNLWYGVQAAGTGASTQTFAGLYSSAGVLLSGSADISALLTLAPQALPLSAPQVMPAGSSGWAAILANFATTQPNLFKIGGVGSIGAMNMNQAAAQLSYCVNGTGLTALPASIVPAANTAVNAFTFWAGGS